MNEKKYVFSEYFNNLLNSISNGKPLDEGYLFDPPTSRADDCTFGNILEKRTASIPYKIAFNFLINEITHYISVILKFIYGAGGDNGLGEITRLKNRLEQKAKDAYQSSDTFGVSEKDAKEIINIIQISIENAVEFLNAITRNYRRYTPSGQYFIHYITGTDFSDFIDLWEAGRYAELLRSFDETIGDVLEKLDKGAIDYLAPTEYTKGDEAAEEPEDEKDDDVVNGGVLNKSPSLEDSIDDDQSLSGEPRPYKMFEDHTRLLSLLDGKKFNITGV